MKSELFISYSRQDNRPRRADDVRGWVTALRDEIIDDHRRFSTEPLTIFLDTDEIRTFDDWSQRILRGLRESRILLVCVSPDYFKSPYCHWEWDEYLARQMHTLLGQDSIAPVVIVEIPDPEDLLAACWTRARNAGRPDVSDRSAW